MIKSITPFLIMVMLVVSMVAVAASLSISGVKRLGSFTYSATWVTVDFEPDVLNLKSKGEPVTVYIELPPGYDVNSIDVSSIKLNEVVPAEPHPTAVGDHDSDGVPDLMLKFDREAVQSILRLGPIPGSRIITITGTVSGTVPDFLGTDTIEVIDD